MSQDPEERAANALEAVGRLWGWDDEELATIPNDAIDIVEEAIRAAEADAFDRAATVDPLDVECQFCRSQERQPCWDLDRVRPAGGVHHSRWSAAIRAEAQRARGKS